MREIMARVFKDPGNFRIHLDNDMFYVENKRNVEFSGDSVDETPEDLLRFLLDHLGIEYENV